MHNQQPITICRDCDGILIPAGTPITIQAGSLVHITQALGGNYTVNINGNLVQIAAKDADALGMENEATETTETDQDITTEDLVWGQLKTCYDPEIPINIVDLGLIYECRITPQEKGDHVDVLMTLTAPGCGMGEFLAEDIRQKLASIENVSSVQVELTFDPPWSQEMMSEAARLATGMY